MLSKDIDARTGVCAICGDVMLAWRKNGYRCPNGSMSYRARPEKLRMKQALKQALRDGKPCEICGAPGQVLDHKHGDKTWRGVLCHKHNSGLGMFNDDPALLRAAAEYLERYELARRYEMA